MRNFFPDYMDDLDFSSDVVYAVSKFTDWSTREGIEIYVYAVFEGEGNIADFLIEAVKEII